MKRGRPPIAEDICAEVIKAYRSGGTSRDIAARFNMGATTVLRIARAGSLRIRGRGRPLGSGNRTETQAMEARRREGQSLTAVGAEFGGISHQAVQQRIAYHRRVYGAP